MSTPKDRIPASVSIADLAKKRAAQAAPKPPAGGKPITEEQRAQLRASLAASIPDKTDSLNEQPEAQMTLPVMEIEFYDRNPRKAPNEDYPAIKESIRATKRLASPLVVTRRPGQKKFMVGKGGNTRLKALQELFTETGDPDYQYTVVTFSPWKSESATLADHLVENELRAPMCFWDKANAYAQMKGLIEQETGSALSGRGFEQALKERGLPVSKTYLSYFSFSVSQLVALSGACADLSLPKVRELQPTFNAHERLLTYLVQESAWPEIRDQVLRSTEQSWLATSELEPAKIIEHLDQAVALKLGEAVEFVRAARDLCQRFPNEDVGGQVAQARLSVRPPAPPVQPQKDAAQPPQAHQDGQQAPTHERPPTTTHKSRGEPASEDQLVAKVQDVATRMARLSEVADCLRLDAAWPTGFYMEIPENDEPIDLTEFGAERYYGWWMLGMLSEQLGGAWSHRMPEDSTWRQAQRQENGRDDFAMQHYMDTILGMPIDPMTLGKRLATGGDAVSLWLELVEALRALRKQAPQRFEPEAA